MTSGQEEFEIPYQKEYWFGGPGPGEGIPNMEIVEPLNESEFESESVEWFKNQMYSHIDPKIAKMVLKFTVPVGTEIKPTFKQKIINLFKRNK